MEKKTLQLAELDLDLENPRTGKSQNQIEALRQLLLIEKFGDKVFALAFDICSVGMLDPGERLYVLQSPTDPARYTALDGNRRVAALRLLSQPTLVDNTTLNMTPQMRQRFKRLQAANSGRWPQELDVVVFDSRASAEHFIGIRHKGELGGAGRSEWSALQIARFDNSGLWQCLQGLRAAGDLTRSVIVAIDSGDYPITTFDRVAGSKAFGTRFGSSIGATEFRIGPTPSKAMKALGLLADDVSSGKVTSRDEYAKADTMGSYLDALTQQVDDALSPKPPKRKDEAEGTGEGGNGHASPPNSEAEQSDGDAGGQPDTGDQSSGSGANGEPDNSLADDPGKKSPLPRKKRESKYLLDRKELGHAHYDSKCSAIVTELNSEVEIKRAPYACALLVRTLQELTADIYMSEVAGYTGPRNASNRISMAAKHLLANPPKHASADMVQLMTAFLTSADVYAELSQVAHNKWTSISDVHVRKTWDTLKDGMSLLWEQIYLKSAI